MAVNAPFDEPAIAPQHQRPIAAMWISLGLHAAVIAWVQVAPPPAPDLHGPVIEARLVPRQTESARPKLPEVLTRRPVVPSPQKETLPVPVTDAAALSPDPAPSAVVPPLPDSSSAAPSPAATPSPPAPSPPAATEAPAVITSAVDLTYYRAREVDVQPRALQEITPIYPDDADRQQVSGSVRIQLKIEADGRVLNAEVISATPPGVFDAAALEAFRTARFSPAQIKGRPVRALVLIEVVFDWEGRPR